MAVKVTSGRPFGLGIPISGACAATLGMSFIIGSTTDCCKGRNKEKAWQLGNR